jgi:hypothetical protein
MVCLPLDLSLQMPPAFEQPPDFEQELLGTSTLMLTLTFDINKHPNHCSKSSQHHQ